jgi:hypothetical protein
MLQVNQVIKHFDPDAGNAVCVLAVKPGKSSKMGKRGKWQHWYYTAQYARGDTSTHCLKCIKIRLNLLPSSDISVMVQSLPAQPFNQTQNPLLTASGRKDKLAVIWSLLTALAGTSSVIYLSSANFKRIPRSEAYSRVGAFFQHLSAGIEDGSHTSVLQGVARELGGPVQRPVPHLQNVLLYPSTRRWKDPSTKPMAGMQSSKKANLAREDDITTQAVAKRQKQTGKISSSDGLDFDESELCDDDAAENEDYDVGQ